MELAEFYDAVCEQTSYVRTLQEKGDMESRGRLENVQELKSNIVSFLENDPGGCDALGLFERDRTLHRPRQRDERQLRDDDDDAQRKGS